MKTLFFYEWKKIVNRKIVLICMLCAVLLIIFSIGIPLVGDYVVNGERLGSNYEEFQKDITYRKALDGRAIDRTLLMEMQNAYEKVPLDKNKYSLTEEYQSYARPYSPIFNYVRQTTGLSAAGVLTLNPDVEDLQEKRLEMQESRWEEFMLSEEEKEYWRAKEEQIENPVVFRYAEGYDVLLNVAYTVGIVTVFMIAISMANVFPEEHTRRMDQQILSSKYGRKQVYWVKMCVGSVVSLGLAFVFVVTAFVSAFVFCIVWFSVIIQSEFSSNIMLFTDSSEAKLYKSDKHSWLFANSKTAKGVNAMGVMLSYTKSSNNIKFFSNKLA